MRVLLVEDDAMIGGVIQEALRDASHAADWVRSGATALGSLAAFTVVSIAFYSDGFRNFRGVSDAVRTFFIYKTGEGHDQPFHHYLQLL